MKQAFWCFIYIVACAANPWFAMSDARASDRFVTPTEQAERSDGVRLSAPSNARPPAEIDVDDLQPTLLRPVIRLLEAIQARQESAFDELEQSIKARQNDRTDEILGAIRGINERQVTIKGWQENKAALEGLTSVFENFRARFERLATVDDVETAIANIPQPEPFDLPDVDLTGIAQEETLLALGDRLPTVANIREITENVASLSARLDNIAAQVEAIDVGGEVETLKSQLKIANLCLVILLGLVAIQVGVFIIRWLISLTKAAREKSRETAENFALLKELIQERKQNKSAT